MVSFFGRSILHIGNFIAQYHFYLVTFVLSSFLARFVGVENVGYIFIVSSFIVALVLYAAPPLFRSFGTRNAISVLAIAIIACLLGLSILTDTTAIIVVVTLYSALAYALFIGIDLLIEASIVRESVTGTTRSTYLAMTNTAVLVASLSLAFIVIGDAYYRAFVFSALALVPFIILSLWFFPRISFPSRDGQSRTVTEQLAQNPSLKKIAGAHLLMQVFFSWMSIYMPILLFSFEGFGWDEIGIILGVAMIPYIILERPLGYIADRWLGEKELLTVGFIIVALSLVVMAFMSGASFYAWIAVMFVSRIGAAMLESMTEVHFFRHVTEKDTSTITFFRVLRPLGSIVGPIVATLSLMLLPIHTTFAVFGVVMLLGIPLALSIVDSK